MINQPRQHQKLQGGTYGKTARPTLRPTKADDGEADQCQRQK